jgi:hypothetical protein
LPGEFKLGSGDVPIDEMALCDSEDEPGESVLEMLEFEKIPEPLGLSMLPLCWIVFMLLGK